MITNKNKKNKKSFQNIPQELRERSNGWGFSFKVETKFNNKIYDAKRPYSSAKPYKYISTNEPESTSTYNDFLELYETKGDEIVPAFVLLKDDPYVMIDVDNCIKDGQMNQKIIDLIKQINSYTEISMSKNGIHIIIKGVLPSGSRRVFNLSDYSIEVYNTHSVCLTGQMYENYKDIKQFTFDQQFQQKYNIQLTKQQATDVYYNTEECNQSACKKYIKLIKNTKHVNLFNGDTSKYNNDSSVADYNMVKAICKYTKNIYQIQYIMNKSGLRREKFDEKCSAEGQTYLIYTIKKVIKELDEKERKIEEQNPDLFGWSDDDNARRIYEKHRDNIRYAVDTDQWIKYNNVVWQRLQQTEVRTLCKEGSEQIKERIDRLPDCKTKDQMKENSKKLQNSIIRSRIVKAIKDIKEVQIRTNQFNNNKDYQYVKNGRINLLTGSFESPIKEDYATKFMEVDFNEKLDMNSKPYKQWVQLIRRCFNDLETYHYTHKALGYSMTKYIKQKKFFILYNEKGNGGKSLLFSIISNVLGIDNCLTLSKDYLCRKNYEQNQPYKIAKLKDKTFVYASQFNKNDVLNEGLINNLTGGERINARQIRQEDEQFYPIFKLWIGTNYVPYITNNESTMARMVIIPTRYIPEEQRIAFDTLVNTFTQPQYKSAILNWLLDGLKLYHTDGLKPTSSMEALKKRCLKNNDRVLEFLNECAEITNSQTDFELGKNLYNSYKGFCLESGYKPEGKMSFFDVLEKKGFHKGLSRNLPAFHGIKFKNQMEHIEEITNNVVNKGKHNLTKT